MNIQHIGAVIWRHAILLVRDPNIVLMNLYWPLLDVFMWGFLGTWLQRDQQIEGMAVLTLLGISLWRILCRVCHRSAMPFLEELWAGNIINVFSSPLRLVDWIVGVVIFSSMIGVGTYIYALSLMWLFYGYTPYSLAFVAVFLPPIVLSGVALGVFTLGLLIYFGRQVQEITIVIPWFFVSFSAVFYPISSLPVWAQKISYCLPMSYIFEGLRACFFKQATISTYLLYGYLLSIGYGLLSFAFFLYMFKKSKQQGLAALQ